MLLPPPRSTLFPYTTLFRSQSLRATGTVVEVDHPTRGKYLSVGNPIKLSDSPAEVTRSPLLGEHTDEILRSEEHTSELQSPCNLVCRLLLEKKKIGIIDLLEYQYRKIY